jgi:hypothetical protein
LLCCLLAYLPVAFLQPLVLHLLMGLEIARPASAIACVTRKQVNADRLKINVLFGLDD